jgi:hypothetical protein
MYRDLNKGLPVESDAIVGDLLAHGKRMVSARPCLPVYVSLSILSAGARVFITGGLR